MGSTDWLRLLCAAPGGFSHNSIISLLLLFALSAGSDPGAVGFWELILVLAHFLFKSKNPRPAIQRSDGPACFPGSSGVGLLLGIKFRPLYLLGIFPTAELHPVSCSTDLDGGVGAGIIVSYHCGTFG